jgi:hypothetical protein
MQGTALDDYHQTQRLPPPAPASRLRAASSLSHAPTKEPVC